jgi:hypothetical protein
MMACGSLLALSKTLEYANMTMTMVYAQLAPRIGR